MEPEGLDRSQVDGDVWAATRGHGSQDAPAISGAPTAAAAGSSGSGGLRRYRRRGGGRHALRRLRFEGGCQGQDGCCMPVPYSPLMVLCLVQAPWAYQVLRPVWDMGARCKVSATRCRWARLHWPGCCAGFGTMCMPALGSCRASTPLTMRRCWRRRPLATSACRCPSSPVNMTDILMSSSTAPFGLTLATLSAQGCIKQALPAPHEETRNEFSEANSWIS